MDSSSFLKLKLGVDYKEMTILLTYSVNMWCSSGQTFAANWPANTKKYVLLFCMFSSSRGS